MAPVLRLDSPLSTRERERMAKFHRGQDQDLFLTAWTLARRTLGELLDQPAAALTFTRTCLHCGHPDHGKPRLPHDRLHFSLSHAGDRVLLAVSELGPVGADVEPVDRDLDGIAESLFHPNESHVAGHDRLRIWVRKEAIVKASGHGLAAEMNKFQVSASHAAAKLVSWQFDPSTPQRTTLRDLPCDDGYLAAAALIHPR